VIDGYDEALSCSSFASGSFDIDVIFHVHCTKPVWYVTAGIRGRSFFNQSKMGGPEGVAASKREVWQGQNRKGTVEAKEDLDFEVAGKATVGGNGGSELVLLFDRCISSEGFFAGDRARVVDDCQGLLLRFDKMTREMVWYGDY